LKSALNSEPFFTSAPVIELFWMSAPVISLFAASAAPVVDTSSAAIAITSAGLGLGIRLDIVSPLLGMPVFLLLGRTCVQTAVGSHLFPLSLQLEG
jgi:hypothetical protein